MAHPRGWTAVLVAVAGLLALAPLAGAAQQSTRL